MVFVSYVSLAKQYSECEGLEYITYS
jgi:hypothetical protein